VTLAGTVTALALTFVIAEYRLPLYGGLMSGLAQSPNQSAIINQQSTMALERERVIAAASQYLARPPQTITAFRAVRSAGGPHDFFSEGDYW